jgi:hypothetical protein
MSVAIVFFMGAPSKRAQRKRAAGEFDVARLAAGLKLPLDGRASVNAWSLDQIFHAREAQMRGDFRQAARMAEQMRTDDALAVAYKNRLAPGKCIDTEIVPAAGARGASIGAEANALFGPRGVALHPDTRADIHGCLVNHGVAFAVAIPTPREDGTRVDYEIRYWPIEFVRWDSFYRCYFARVDNADLAAMSAGLSPASADPTTPPAVLGAEVQITHGDGRWIVFKAHDDLPFRHDAAILSAALVWARHAFACRDWAKGSVAHGSAKVVGELPAGVPLQSSDGSTLSSEATAFLSLLQAIASSDAPVGIRPSGAKTEFVTNTSTAWQVWKELVDNAEKASARIYLGTDGTLGASGGAPGVDITALFGVALTIVRGDLDCISRGINTGVIEPWCAMNFGDSALAPVHRYKVPDEDEKAYVQSFSSRQSALLAVIKAYRENGFAVTQEQVNELAGEYNVPAPILPDASSKAPTIALAPTDIARVVSVNEARASAGLGPLLDEAGSPDPAGRLTVEEYAARKKAQAEASPDAPAPPAPTPIRRAAP